VKAKEKSEEREGGPTTSSSLRALIANQRRLLESLKNEGRGEKLTFEQADRSPFTHAPAVLSPSQSTQEQWEVVSVLNPRRPTFWFSNLIIPASNRMDF